MLHFLLTQARHFCCWKWWFLHSKFASAVSKCRGFCQGISRFFSICLGKKNAEAIKFLEILKKYVSKNKIYFCLKNKRNVPLNKKLYFVFHMISKLDFITQIIYCIICKYLHSLFILFYSLISVFKK